MTNNSVKGTYAYDKAFLQAHTAHTIELLSPDSSSKLLLSPDYQGRVMTSTATGDTGASFGWMNYNLIAAKEKKKQFNPVGGEERFWLGPEGGQYSLYFKAGDSFNIAHWQVPPIIDTVSYNVAASGADHAIFTQKAEITNYIGTTFNLDIERSIHLLTKQDLENKLQTTIPINIHFVAFETQNTITNTGQQDWTQEKACSPSGSSACLPPRPKPPSSSPSTPYPTHVHT